MILIDNVNTYAKLWQMDVHYTSGLDSFVWDIVKAQKNMRKHGILFEDAIHVFSDPLFVLVDASRNEEAREAVIGFDASGRLLFVVHMEVDDGEIRIISARKASEKEGVLYDI